MQCCCVPKFLFHWIPWLPMVPIYYSMKWHVRILISLDTMATKATNLICNVVVYQNSCFIGYHGYQWYQYVFFPIKPFCLRFYRNRVSGEVEGEGGGDGVKVEGKIGRTELPAAVRFLRLRNPFLSLLLFIFYYQRVISAVNHQFLLKCISIIQIGQKYTTKTKCFIILVNKLQLLGIFWYKNYSDVRRVEFYSAIIKKIKTILKINDVILNRKAE